MNPTLNTFFRTLLLMIGCLLTSIQGIQAEPEQPITFLHYYSWPDGERAMNNVMRSIQQAHPQVHIQAKSFDAEAFKVSISAMLAGGAPPNLFLYWAGARTQALVKKGWLATIDEVWDQARLPTRFSPAVAQACQYNGHTYMLPLTQYYIAFFYNKKLFEAHEIALPTTWTEFLTACQRLKAAGITPIALGTMDKWPAQAWFDYLLLRTAGPAYRQRLMNGTASYADPEVLRVFELWKELVEHDYFTATPGVYNWEDAVKMVFYGQAAMTLKAHWVMSVFDGELGWTPQEDYDFFVFPVLDPAIPDVAVGPIDGVLLPRQPNDEMARKVLPYFAAAGPQLAMSRVTGSLSPNMRIPATFYSEIQQRIRQIVERVPYWAFNYDLATPPPVAEIGLQGFVDFLETPARYQEILRIIDRQVENYFSTREAGWDY